MLGDLAFKLENASKKAQTDDKSERDENENIIRQNHEKLIMLYDNTVDYISVITESMP